MNMLINTNIEVQNYPKYADKYNYITCRLVDTQFWFYGAYETYEEADVVASAFENGLVISRNDE